MRELSLSEIRNLSTSELVDGLRKQEYSLLQSLGFRKLRAEMNFTGLICRMIITLTGLRKEFKSSPNGVKLNSRARKRTERLLHFAAPARINGEFPTPASGMVVGFNHPSLGEILRFIYICMTVYRDKRNLFPVNLPWYEALMPIVGELETLGIYIMPVITPSTRDKMARVAGDETMEVVFRLSSAMNTLYLSKCAEFIKNQDNIWLAPSATRRRFVFDTRACVNGEEEIKPQTMTLLAIQLKRSGVTECDFLPVGVSPCFNFRRGLNLFRRYTLIPSDIIPFDEVVDLARERYSDCGGSRLEHDFRIKIASRLVQVGKIELVCPFS